jgi:hypothetical protein
MHRRVALIALAVVTLGAAACGSDDSPAGTDAPSSTTVPTTTVEPGDVPAPPTDPDAALLTIDGGVPAITADGRVFMRVDGPQGLTAALPLGEPTGALTVAQLTPDGLIAVLAEAEALGLLGTPPDYGDPGITDQGYLRVTLATADGTFEHSVYAPGEETGDAEADAARDRLDDFVHFVDTLQMQLGDEISDPMPYVPEQWVIDTSPYVEQHDVTSWPFDIDPVDGCVALPSDAATDTASGVYSATLPGGTGREHIVEVRPALPFDDC